MAFQQVLDRHQLRIGLFIKLNASWFSHPFPTNTFKIKTVKDLNTLQALRKVEIFWDPERSDPPDAENAPAPGIAAVVQPVLDARPGDEPAAGAPQPAGAKSIQKLSPAEAFANHCEAFEKADRVYQESFHQSKMIMQELSYGVVGGIEKARELVATFGSLVGDAEAMTGLLHVMNAHAMGASLFSHAMNVCILSQMVGRELGLTEEELEDLSLGALFHDIGELNVPGKILLKRRNLSPSERDIYRQHPKFGRDTMKKFHGFPPASLQVIYQHHERLDGSGYPMGLKGEHAIGMLSKIVMAVDWYDDVCNDADPDIRLTPSEALSHLFVKQKAVFWNEAVVALIRILGVYPPGSLVRLNEGQIGMVVSINERARMRPFVILYAEQAIDEPPAVLDLEEHDHLSITQNLKPRDVPSRIREYLNPRRMVTYRVSPVVEEGDSISVDR